MLKQFELFRYFLPRNPLNCLLITVWKILDNLGILHAWTFCAFINRECCEIGELNRRNSSVHHNLIQRIILFILCRNSEQERHPDVKCFAELVFTVASLPRRLIKPLFALGGCQLQSRLAISDAQYGFKGLTAQKMAQKEECGPFGTDNFTNLYCSKTRTSQREKN